VQDDDRDDTLERVLHMPERVAVLREDNRFLVRAAKQPAQDRELALGAGCRAGRVQ